MATPNVNPNQKKPKWQLDKEAAEAAAKALEPPPPPDLTDKLIQKSRLDQMFRTLSSRGRRSTFLTGPLGLTDPAKLNRKTLLGGM